MSLSQWECLFKNVGEWQGSFTRLSPLGEFIEDTPTKVTLEGRNNNQTMYQVVHYLPVDQPPRDLVLEYTSLNRSILFFDNGAFSQGSLQWGPYSEFGAEFGLIAEDRRLRMVQLFNNQGQFDRLTLIREKLPHSTTPERPPLTVEQLLGNWHGEAVTIYPDWRSPDTYYTTLTVSISDSDQITQSLTFAGRTITSKARVDHPVLYFEESELPCQIILLPDGASCNTPRQIKPRQAFFVEMGWLLTPCLRQRLIRSYGDKGDWQSATLVTEHKSA